MRILPRSIFGQLVLIITFVLIGSGVLVVLIGREFAMRPAAGQLLKAVSGFADVAEALADTQSAARTAQLLRGAGLNVSEAPPANRPVFFAPLMHELEARAHPWRNTGRELRVSHDGDSASLWLKLDTQPALWVSFALDRRAQIARRFSTTLMLGSALLAWLAAAYLAKRLVMPLRQLAEDAPAVVRGEPPDLAPPGSPREIVELADAMKRSAQEVRLAAEERAFMLAGISHDLRTPLTRIRFALEMLANCDSQLRGGMERDIDEIDTILAQFIAYSRDGRDEACERVDLAEICQNAVAASATSWRTIIPASAVLSGKPTALLRAVENLLVNAERYGQPPYSLHLARGQDAWSIEVRDCGPGLSEQDRERMRQPFVHGRDGGTGLGLAIVERVARQHGGELVLGLNAPSGLCARLTLRGAQC